MISASGVATVLRDARARPQNQRRPQRRTGSPETAKAAPPRLDTRGNTQLQCTIPSGAKVNGAGSSGRRTGRATPTSSGRPGRARTRRRSDRGAGSARRARPCLRRNAFIEMRSAIQDDRDGTAPRRPRDVIRTRDEPPRTMEEGVALSRQPASKRPSFAIDPNPPRPRDGRNVKR